MAGMGDGYVGTAQDAVRIRRLEKQREAERKKIQDLKNKTASSQGQPGLLQFGSSTSEVLETAFKKETVGLVTREQYVEKRVNIRTKFEEEEKEKLQKLQKEEEELQAQKRKKRKVKGNSRLSFSEDIVDASEEEEEQNTQVEALLLSSDEEHPTVQATQPEVAVAGAQLLLELNRELIIPEAVPTPVVEEFSSEEEEAGARVLPVAPALSAQPQPHPQPQSPEIEMSLSVADVSQHAVPIATDFSAVLSSIQFLTNKVQKLEDRARRSEEFEDKMTAFSKRHAESLEDRARRSEEFEDRITSITARHAESLASIEFLMRRHYNKINKNIVSSGEKMYEGINAVGTQIEEIVNYYQEARQRIDDKKGEGQASGARAQGSSSRAGRGAVRRPPAAARGTAARGAGRGRSVFEKLLGDEGSRQ